MQYSARCIARFIETTDEPLHIISSRANVPIKGVEKILPVQVQWIPLEDTNPDLVAMLPEIPRVLVVVGWSRRSFRNAVERLGALGKTKIIVAIDHNCPSLFSSHVPPATYLRALASAAKYRLLRRGRYHDGFFVTSERARRLMRLYGMPPEKVAIGLNAADGSVFTNGEPLASRPKRVIYVGKFIPRKNLRRVCKAWIKAAAGTEWKLALYGRGPLAGKLPRHENIEYNDFLQIEELAAEYRRSRAMILASVEDHWGMVVHEAALCGCFLLLSDTICAAEDFAAAENSLLFNPYSVGGMAKAFKRFMSLNDSELSAAQEVSLARAKLHSPDRYARSLHELIQTLGKN